MAGSDALAVLRVVGVRSGMDIRRLQVVVASVEVASGPVAILENLGHVNGSVRAEIQAVLARGQGRGGHHCKNNYAEFFHNIQI